MPHNPKGEPLQPVKMPQRPSTLPALAEELLTEISKYESSANIVLGGGVALKHYDDFRETQDVDAWWKTYRDLQALDDLGAAVSLVAKRNAFRDNARRFGATDSLEIVGPDDKMIFSFQIAVRDLTLDEPLPSAWPPIQIESLRDNVASKMNALVRRGAPRDFVDIYRLVNDGLITGDECWSLWSRKNEGANAERAAQQMITHLDRLEQLRPLDAVAVDEKKGASALRAWFRRVFFEDARALAAGHSHGMEPGPRIDL